MRKPSLALFLFFFSVSFALAEPADTQLPTKSSIALRFFWFKSSRLEQIADHFSNFVDALSLRFSDLLGGWSREPLLFQITPAKIFLLLIVFLLGVALAALARWIILRFHALGRARPITERYWRNGILFALRRGLSAFFILTGAFFAVIPILPHIGLAVGGYPTFAVAAKIAEIGYFGTLLAFCFRIARLVQFWLKAFPRRENARWYYSALPVLGRAIYFNLALIAIPAAISLLELPAWLQGLGYRLVSVAGIAANTALMIQTILAIEAMVFTRSEAYDAFKRRRVATRARIFRRLAVFVVLVVGVASILLNFEPFRQLGTGLLASAGVAGVIAGFAAQKSLSTIIAGMQIAVTQPMRIDDVVIVEGEWGIIEEITLTYVVVKIWDQRNLIVPITYFLEKPFQNWTRKNAELMGTVFLYVDFTVPIEEVRAEAKRILESTPLWDKRVFAVQITDFKSDSVEIRILSSAESSPAMFDLRCLIREKILIFLQQSYENAFPRARVKLAHVGRDGEDIEPGGDARWA